MTTRDQEAPTFKGYDEEGEPVFVWDPATPQWLRDEYARLWKATHRRAPASPKEGGRHE